MRRAGRDTSSRSASMPAGPANPASEPGIASPPRTAPARAARDPGDHPRLLSVIYMRQPGISCHDRPLCPIDGFRYVRASMAYIGPEQGQECAPYGDRSRHGGLMILISPVAQGSETLRIPAPDNLLILSIVPGWA